MGLIIPSLIALSFCIAYKLYLDKQTKKKEKANKDYLNSIFALSTSHLHDASNFFSLIKNNLQSKDDKTISFARGAAYHFRSLFEELRSSKELFDCADFDLLVKNKVKLFHKKEQIDLKDLLELELFQVSDFERLRFINKVNSEHAWIEGNFSLLSKALINLIENALKYTDEDVTVELSSSTSGYELRIKSRGTGIPENIINEIKNNPMPKLIGHGLESLMDIMEFHDAALGINTIQGAGSSVNLCFKEMKKDRTIDNMSQGKQNLSMPKQSLAYLIPVLVIFALFGISVFNKNQCEAFYKNHSWVSKNSLNDFSQPKSSSLTSKNQIDQIIDQFRNNNIEEFEKLENRLVSSYEPSKHDLIKLIVFESIKNESSIYTEDYLIERGQDLLKKYPSSSSLHYSISELYLNQHDIIHASIYSATGLMSLIKSWLLMDRDLFLVDRLFKDQRVYEFLDSKI